MKLLSSSTHPEFYILGELFLSFKYGFSDLIIFNKKTSNKHGKKIK